MFNLSREKSSDLGNTAAKIVKTTGKAAWYTANGIGALWTVGAICGAIGLPVTVVVGGVIGTMVLMGDK